MSTFGRNRESIADIEEKLKQIFTDHEDSHINQSGEPVIPATALPDVFRAFSNDGDELMTPAEMDMVKTFIDAHPGLELTPVVLINFIAEKTKASPPAKYDEMGDEDVTLHSSFSRGRQEEREVEEMMFTGRAHSRSSSNGSAYPGSRPPSRGPPPQTPAKNPSVFDRRQRSTPLANNAPSSWTGRRPAPAGRRKSDAGSRSDSESFSTSPSAYGQPGRSRAPSNPTSPYLSSSSQPNLTFSPGSPSTTSTLPSSRPHSRAQSQPQSYFLSKQQRRRNSNGDDFDFGSHQVNLHSMMDEMENESGVGGDTFRSGMSTLRMPRLGMRSTNSIGSGGSEGFQSDPLDSHSPHTDPETDNDEEEETSLGLVMDRTTTSSNASLEPMERLDALQKANMDLSKKLIEAERTLSNKLEDHEVELEEMQARFEELQSELSATKREEKELRSKERQAHTQIGGLESEIAKLQKNLEIAKGTYEALSRQYREQCAESERNRNVLRRRDDEIKDLKEAAMLHQLESSRFTKVSEQYEERITMLEGELVVARETAGLLEEQKQENLFLKESMDRMRYEMDEMRASMASNVASSLVPSNAPGGSVSKSLGAELLEKMRWGYRGEGAVDEGEEEEGRTEERSVEEGEDEDETEGEDVVQTIITRKTRKVASRAAKIETRSYEEVKEYSDVAIQHEAAKCTSTDVQTDPPVEAVKASLSTQTEAKEHFSYGAQTEPESTPLPKIVSTIEIQTDAELLEEDETLASSSSTILPLTLTPKASSSTLHPDLPPTYNQVTALDDPSSPASLALLQHYHKGITSFPPVPVPSGVSDDTVEEWDAMKRELGVECLVIDRVIECSKRTVRGMEGEGTSNGGSARRKSGRFYNIYNTYVYGSGAPSSTSAPAPSPSTGRLPGGLLTHLALCMSASALVMYTMGSMVTPSSPSHPIPGGVNYYDRAAWNSFNTMPGGREGFVMDGTGVVWSFLGRVGGGAARIARGWPT